MNKELISRAVARRLVKVRDRIQQFDPQTFGDAGFFLTSVKEILRDQPDRLSMLTPFDAPEEWAASNADCLTSLRVLSLHGSKAMPREPYPPPEKFLSQLKTNHSAQKPVGQLLEERYAWPLNFAFGGEHEIREYLLMQLMTSVRTRIENKSVAPVNGEDLLLKLNLVSVHAATATDLRFLDALNYYYELLPATLFSESQHAWLLVSWFALYARALTSWS